MEQNDKYLGKRIDSRYEIQSLIGAGGMALVYKAYDLIDDRILSEASKECEKIYVGKRFGKHSMKQEQINAILIEKCRQGK